MLGAKRLLELQKGNLPVNATWSYRRASPETQPSKARLCPCTDDMLMTIAIQLCFEMADRDEKDCFYWSIPSLNAALKRGEMFVLARKKDILGFCSFRRLEAYIQIDHFQSFVKGGGQRMLELLELELKPSQFYLLSFESAVGFWKKMGFRVHKKGYMKDTFVASNTGSMSFIVK